MSNGFGTPGWGSQRAQLDQRLLYEPLHPFITANQVPVFNHRVPNELAHCYQDICQELVCQIQDNAGSNQLRALFFNRMAANGFNNQDFSNLVGKALEGGYVVCSVVGSEAPLQGWLVEFVSYNVARQFDMAAQFLDNQIINTARNVVAEFEMKMTAAERQLTGNGGNQRFGGGSGFGGGGFGGRTAQASAPSWANSSASASQAPAALPSWAARATQNQTAAATPATPSWKAEAARPAPEPVKKVEPPKDVTLDFERSDKYPHDMQFDPNYVVGLRYVEKDGLVEIYNETRKNVDRSLHLVKPKHSKAWTVDVPLTLAEERLELLRKDPEKAVTFVGNTTDLAWALHLPEKWVELESYLPKEPQKTVTAALLKTMLIEPVLTNRDLNLTLAEMTKAEGYADVVEILKRDMAHYASNQSMLKALHTINRRLTDRYNRLISNQATLEYGQIDSFVEDVLDSMNVIKDYYGEAVYGPLDKTSQAILCDALSVVSEESQETYDALSGFLLRPVSDNEEDEVPSATFFCESIGLIQLSIQSSELCMDTMNGDRYCVLNGTQTPFAKLLIDLVVNKLGGTSECPNYRIRTSDGVVFVLEISPFMPDRFLIGLEK